MGFLLKLLKLVDEGKNYITEPHWMAIVKKADKETLEHMSEFSFNEWKYFNRDDWLGKEATARIWRAVHDRLSELEVEEWLKELL